MPDSPRLLQDVSDLSREEVFSLFEQTKAFQEILQRPIRKVPTLRGKGIALFFAEPSTRTRVSFEIAARTLSADVTSIALSTSSIQKGESLADTFATLSRLPFDLAVIRHPYEGAAQFAFQWFQRSVINGGDGCHAHPTQALLDAYTLWARGAKLSGLRLTYVGDIAHSRVARSGLKLFSLLGAQVAVCAPPYFLPLNVSRVFPQVKVYTRLSEALANSQVLIALRVQKEREKSFYSSREYLELFGIGGKVPSHLLIMHPGPVLRGFELSREVLHSDRSLIGDQVENGTALRMALLYTFLAGN